MLRIVLRTLGVLAALACVAGFLALAAEGATLVADGSGQEIAETG